MSAQPMAPNPNKAIVEPSLATKHYCHLQILKSLQNRQPDVESESHRLYDRKTGDDARRGRSELDRGLSWISRALVPSPNKGHITAVCLTKEVKNQIPGVVLNVSSNVAVETKNKGVGKIAENLFVLLKRLFAEQEAHLSIEGRLTIDPTLLESQRRELQNFTVSYCWKSVLGRIEDLCGLPLPALRPDLDQDRAVSDLKGSRKGYIDDYVRVFEGLHKAYNANLQGVKDSDDRSAQAAGDIERLTVTFRRILEHSLDAREALKSKIPLAADEESKAALFNEVVELCSQLLTDSSLLGFVASFVRLYDSHNKEHEVPAYERMARFSIEVTYNQFVFLAKIHRRIDRLVQYCKGSMSVVQGVFAEMRTHCKSDQFQLRMACTLVPELKNGNVKPTVSPKDYCRGVDTEVM